MSNLLPTVHAIEFMHASAIGLRELAAGFIVLLIVEEMQCRFVRVAKL
jgi:hypothetical protein